jgi:DNA-binding GntR family transcriptional regulator
MMSVSLSWPRRPAKTLKEHGEIIKAIKDGNSDKAEKVVRIHIREASKGVLRNVKQYVRRDMEGIGT